MREGTVRSGALAVTSCNRAMPAIEKSPAFMLADSAVDVKNVSSLESSTRSVGMFLSPHCGFDVKFMNEEERVNVYMMVQSTDQISRTPSALDLKVQAPGGVTSEIRPAYKLHCCERACPFGA